MSNRDVLFFRSIVGVGCWVAVSGRGAGHIGRDGCAGRLRLLDAVGLLVGIDHLVAVGRAGLAPEQQLVDEAPLTFGGERHVVAHVLADRRIGIGCAGLLQERAFAGTALGRRRRQGRLLLAGAEHRLLRPILSRDLLGGRRSRLRRTQGVVGRDRQGRPRDHRELVGNYLFHSERPANIGAAAKRHGQTYRGQYGKRNTPATHAPTRHAPRGLSPASP